MALTRRRFGQLALLSGLAGLLPVRLAQARTYLSVEQARQLIWGDAPLAPHPVALTEAQRQAIQRASGVRVRNLRLNAWKTAEGDWFLVDQVIGKHENIDLAVGISRAGQITGIEILTYRETYGYEIAHPKWRAQFFGVDFSRPLKLDRDIKNISGATLSCAHVTDGINRLTQTWQLVLRALA